LADSPETLRCMTPRPAATLFDQGDDCHADTLQQPCRRLQSCFPRCGA
jgi:hypothetical protein